MLRQRNGHERPPLARTLRHKWVEQALPVSARASSTEKRGRLLAALVAGEAFGVRGEAPLWLGPSNASVHPKAVSALRCATALEKLACLEAFGIARRIACDAARGRLWICRAG